MNRHQNRENRHVGRGNTPDRAMSNYSCPPTQPLTSMPIPAPEISVSCSSTPAISKPAIPSKCPLMVRGPNCAQLPGPAISPLRQSRKNPFKYAGLQSYGLGTICIMSNNSSWKSKCAVCGYQTHSPLCGSAPLREKNKLF